MSHSVATNSASRIDRETVKDSFLVKVLLSKYAFGVVALTALFFRSPTLFTSPRFWAEEATLYLSTAWSTGAGVLLAVFNGNYQLLLNFAAFLASLTPYVIAPYVTTYLALTVLVLTLVLFSAALLGRRVPRWKILVFVLIISLLPSGYETYLNATNIQWVVAVSLLAILAMRREQIDPKLAYPWALACGLTGVPSCILGPVFFAYGSLLRSRPHVAIGLILLACAVVQIIIIKSSGVSGRSFVLTPTVHSFSFFLQTIDAPLLGPTLTGNLASWLNAGIANQFVLMAVTLLAASIAIGLAMLADDKRLSITISASWIFVTFVQVFGSLGDPAGLISGGGGGRYFQFGACCFCLLACLGSASASSFRRSTSTVVLVALLTSGIISASNTNLSGPSWNSALSMCRELPCSVAIWPPGWTVQIPPATAR